MGPDQMGPDQMGPDQMGPDQMGPDQMGPDQMGTTPFFEPDLPLYADLFCSKKHKVDSHVVCVTQYIKHRQFRNHSGGREKLFRVKGICPTKK